MITARHRWRRKTRNQLIGKRLWVNHSTALSSPALRGVHYLYSEQRYETVGRVYVGLPPQFAALER